MSVTCTSVSWALWDAKNDKTAARGTGEVLALEPQRYYQGTVQLQFHPRTSPCCSLCAEIGLEEPHVLIVFETVAIDPGMPPSRSNGIRWLWAGIRDPAPPCEKGAREEEVRSIINQNPIAFFGRETQNTFPSNCYEEVSGASSEGFYCEVTVSPLRVKQKTLWILF
ncbi:hypothetical protein NPIL_543241 [Nephila pilipes]|uniref:Uncharacterized protein n=1 Tax=Nephila pilipes TaxID=299642 RepID=A0A8X6Q425_NEPPI|nr:hypothetical protein NPIL_543241 [Nephila pilipes]